MHDPVTSNSRLTCVTAGKYMIVGQVRMSSNSTGYRWCGIRLNGATQLVVDSKTAVNGGATMFSVSTIADLSVADYVELVCYQNSGGALTIVKSANDSPEFAASRVA